jgi:hypothetical protein
MVNETVLIYETDLPIPMTCADGTGIEKGACLTLSDPMTCALSTSSVSAQAGIAAEEKIASDGKTKIGVYRGGIFKVTASGSVTVGTAVAFQDNYACGNQEINHEYIAGIALETATDGETFLMELKPMHYNLA